jgi:ribosomal protein S18 acetylase RimI-like enzyme
MTNDEVLVRPAGLSDLDALVPLFDGYRQFYEQPSDARGARAFLQERLERAESVIFIATRGKTALGFTQLYPSFSSVSMKRLWILNDLFVAPEGRRQGVGARLLERARDFAAETEAKGLELTTARDNLSAQALYESQGWARDNVFMTYYLPV